MPLLILIVAVALSVTACRSGRDKPQDVELRPHHAVDLIIRAFDRYPLVALSDGAGHGQPETRDFFAALIRDPRFPRVARNIVIEFGNARYQSVLDRYVSGEAVTRDELRPVWQNTTQVTGVWSHPMYERMLEDVRSVNSQRPSTLRIRVLAGDPPIDWSTVVSPADEDMNDWRDAHFAHLVEQEVINRSGKALLFIGGAHISRTVIFPNSLIHLLDARFPRRTWVLSVLDIARVDPSVAARLGRWNAPAAASVRGTWLGRVPVQQIGFTLARPALLEDDVDAVAVLGPAAPQYDSSAPLELAYRRELARRRALAEATLPFRGGKIRFQESGTLFASGTEDALRLVLAELVRDRELKLLIKAFADATEPEPIMLSTRRAERLVEWLTERGVERARLVAKGCGALRPLNFGTTATDRALNRRAELVRITPTAGCEPPW